MNERDLEAEFDALVKSDKAKKIDELIKQSRACLDEAIKIADECGLPFRSSVEPVYEIIYTPVKYHADFTDQGFWNAIDFIGFQPAMGYGSDGNGTWLSSTWCIDRDND